MTRFHYTNPVHPKLAIVTGMTRDGTFLVEGGRIVGPVRNLRFTQSYLDALAGVEAVGRERRRSRASSAACVVPALRIDAWTFTGRDRALSSAGRAPDADPTGWAWAHLPGPPRRRRPARGRPTVRSRRGSRPPRLQASRTRLRTNGTAAHGLSSRPPDRRPRSPGRRRPRCRPVRPGHDVQLVGEGVPGDRHEPSRVAGAVRVLQRQDPEPVVPIPPPERPSGEAADAAVPVEQDRQERSVPADPMIAAHAWATQNSLPAGSAMTVQRRPGRSSTSRTRVAPSPTSRSTSAARSAAS